MRRYRGSVIRNPAGVFVPAESSPKLASAAPEAGGTTENASTAPFDRLVRLSNEVTGMGIAVFDERIRFVEINPTLAGLNSLPKAAHTGRPLSGIVPELGAKLTELAHRALDQRSPLKDLKFTARVPFEYGPVRDWLASFFPIDLGGGVAGVAHTLVEVTEQKRVEAVLADLALGTSESIHRIELTTREADVLALIGHGKSTKEIAALLGISVETVGNHRKQLCRKLNLHSATELAIYAATSLVPLRSQR